MGMCVCVYAFDIFFSIPVDVISDVVIHHSLAFPAPLVLPTHR